MRSLAIPLPLVALLLLPGCPPDDDDDSASDDDDAPSEVREAFGAAAGSYLMEASSVAGADLAGVMTQGQLYGVTVSDTEFDVSIGTNTGVAVHTWDPETTVFGGDPANGTVTITLTEEDLSGAGVVWSESFGGLTGASLVLDGGAVVWSLSPQER